MIYLRPHHILCIQQFKGYGYNEEFVKNMFNILEKINKEQIIIKTDFDDICKKCPNLINNLCVADNDINQLDNKVLTHLKIDLDKPIYFDQLNLHLTKNLTEDVFFNICGSCSWYKNGFCKYENFNFH